jgi:hypothetical protein
MGCFGGHGLLKVPQVPGKHEEIPRESSSRDPPEDVAFRDSRVAGKFQCLRRARGREFRLTLLKKFNNFGNKLFGSKHGCSASFSF